MIMFFVALLLVVVVVETHRTRKTTQSLLVALRSHAEEMGRRSTFLHASHKDERDEDIVWRTEHHAKVTELLQSLYDAQRPTVPSPIPVPAAMRSTKPPKPGTAERESGDSGAWVSDRGSDEGQEARTTIMTRPDPALLQSLLGREDKPG